MPVIFMVPTRTRKPGKTGEHFPVGEKLGNFVKTRKVREFYTKYWKNQKKIILENLKQYCKSRGKLSTCNSENVAITGQVSEI